MNFSIIKIPFDKCIVEKERRGAALAPNQIEKELNDFFQFEALKTKTEFLEIKETNDFNKLHKEVEKTALAEYKKKNLVVGLGGDHSVSYGLMKAFAKKFPRKSGLIYFDAHFDCQDDFLPPTHEDVLCAAVKEKFFAGQNILVAGARNYTEKERAFVKKEDITFSQELREHDVIAFCERFENIYVSIDIDALDPAFAPGTGWPEPAGLHPRPLLNLLRLLKATNEVKGFDIVEVSPPKDVNNITVRLAARILLELIK